MSDRSYENDDESSKLWIEIWIIREMNILTIATWTLDWEVSYLSEVSRGETL